MSKSYDFLNNLIKSNIREKIKITAGYIRFRNKMINPTAGNGFKAGLFNGNISEKILIKIR
jgi:hypothetical protein